MAQAQEIINRVASQDAKMGNLLTLMWKVGLRVTEAAYLRSQDIDLVNGMIRLNQKGNPNRTKGGRPRSVSYRPEYHQFMAALKNSSLNQPSDHLFKDRRSLPDRARKMVRDACRESDIPCLGTHAFRKAFSVEEYHQARSLDRQALLAVSRQLGHNRVDVTRQSYIPPQERGKGK
jgi:integrase